MNAKDVRNLIVSLFVIIIGIRLVLNITSGFLSQVPEIPIDVPPLEGIGNTFIVFLAVLMLILVPVYLSKRSKERREQLGKSVLAK